MPTRRLEFITRADVQARPTERFVFGDNMQRYGLGGQAAAMRGEPNALGVATLYAPGDRFMRGDAEALAAVIADLKHVADALARDEIVNVPTNLPGSGIADLHNRWPELQALIAAFFAAADTIED